MSIDDLPPMVTCRALIQSQVQQLLQNRTKTRSDSSVSDGECTELIQQLSENDEDGSKGLSKPRLDAIFRDRFANIVATSDISEPGFEEIWIIIDLVTILSDAECCEPALNFYLIEELLDSQGIEGCRKVMDYLEPRRERMLSKYFKEKQLVILRCFNELLRRLSRAEDTVFCGRAFIYMFQCFPLGEKSSVNLRGLFHTDNVTTFDASPKKSEDAIKPMEIDTDPTQPPSGAQTPASTAPDSDTISKTGRSTPLPRAAKSEPKAPEEPPPDLDSLYPKFWSLQAIFCSPPRLFDSNTMSQFKEGIAMTLSCFKSISTSTSSSVSTASQPTTGTKRKHSDISATPFNSKYLTNRDLFDLEIHDLAFRRHILVQSLIMLDFLLSLTPTAKTKVDDLLNWTPPPKNENETEEEKDAKVVPNKSVLYTHTLSPEDEKWCTSTRAQICAYLQSQGSGNEGRMYTRMVETVLSRDKNWVRWKAESCPLIKRKPISATTYTEAQKTLLDIAKSANGRMPNPPGANDFSFLNQTSNIEDLKRPSQRFRVPSLQQYYDQIQTDDLDMDFANSDAEKREIEERKAGRVWRALRASVLEGRRVGLCEKLRNMPAGDKSVNGDLKAKENALGEVWNLKALIGEEEEEVEDAKEEGEGKDGANGDAPTSVAAVGTPAPVDDDATPADGTSGTMQTDHEEAEQPPPSPKPEHISERPTAEEGTPTPVVDVDGTLEENLTVSRTVPTDMEEADAEAEAEVSQLDVADPAFLDTQPTLEPEGVVEQQTGSTDAEAQQANAGSLDDADENDTREYGDGDGDGDGDEVMEDQDQDFAPGDIDD